MHCERWQQKKRKKRIEERSEERESNSCGCQGVWRRKNTTSLCIPCRQAGHHKQITDQTYIKTTVYWPFPIIIRESFREKAIRYCSHFTSGIGRMCSCGTCAFLTLFFASVLFTTVVICYYDGANLQTFLRDLFDSLYEYTVEEFAEYE